jgi:hypothetical protein
LHLAFNRCGFTFNAQKAVLEVDRVGTRENEKLGAVDVVIVVLVCNGRRSR